MRLSRFFRRRDQDADLARELDAHLQHEADDYVAQGLPQEEAIRRARVKLGSTTRIREDVWSGTRLALRESCATSATPLELCYALPASPSWPCW